MSLRVNAVAPETKLFTVPASDIQTGVSVEDGMIFGTLKYLDGSDPISGYWGAGNFLALDFSRLDPNATSIKVGMDPSQGSGLSEIIGDPDHNGVFKVTDKDTQVFKVVITDGNLTKTQTYDLSHLTVENS